LSLKWAVSGKGGHPHICVYSGASGKQMPENQEEDESAGSIYGLEEDAYRNRFCVYIPPAAAAAPSCRHALVSNRNRVLYISSPLYYRAGKSLLGINMGASSALGKLLREDTTERPMKK